MCIDEGDQEDAQDFMQVTHAIRRVLTVLNRLNNRVNTCYDFNADPDSISLEVGDALRGYVAPDSVRPGSPVAAAPQAPAAPDELAELGAVFNVAKDVSSETMAALKEMERKAVEMLQRGVPRKDPVKEAVEQRARDAARNSTP
jgi:hypothetical protein